MLGKRMRLRENWGVQRAVQYLSVPVNRKIALNFLFIGFCLGAGKTRIQKNCPKMRQTPHVICALCWALFHFGLQILRLETFPFCRLNFYGVFFSCIKLCCYCTHFSSTPRKNISPQFPQLRKAGSQQHAHVEGSGQHCNTCQLP